MLMTIQSREIGVRACMCPANFKSCQVGPFTLKYRIATYHYMKTELVPDKSECRLWDVSLLR